MKRVSSRQRLVSWDAFDAHDAAAEDSSSSTTATEYYETSPVGLVVDQEILGIAAVTSDMMLLTTRSHSSDSLTYTSLKRKRKTTKRKTERRSSSSSRPQEPPTSAAVSAAVSVDMPPRKKQDPQVCWMSLPNDVQLNICSFLTVAETRFVMHSCSKMRALLHTHVDSQWLWKNIHVPQAWPHCCNTKQELQHQQHVVSSTNLAYFRQPALDEASCLDYSALLQLQLSTFPTTIDTSLLAPCRWSRSLHRYRTRSQTPAELQIAPTLGHSPLPAIQFTGMVGAGDRCIRSNQAWTPPVALPAVSVESSAAPNGTGPLARLFPLRPRYCSVRVPDPSQHSSYFERFRRRHQQQGETGNQDRPLRWKPFVIPFAQASPDGGSVCWNFTPRLVQYYEVAILPATPRSQQDARPRPFWMDEDRQFHRHANAPECVAVGLSLQEFSLHTRMPGWDNASYGYHGDDGGVFYGTGHMLRPFGPSFGVGDIVGCGVDYHLGCIFFTINGKHLGAAWKDLPDDFYQQEWYPTVGMDTMCLVQCNFGTCSEQPFCFDLASYIQQNHTPAIMQRRQHFESQFQPPFATTI